MKVYISVLILLLININIYSQICFSNAEEAVSYALKNSQSHSLELQSAQLAFKSANLAISEFMPTFDFTLNEDDVVSFNSSDSRNKSISFNINYKIFDGGKRFLTYKMNKAEKFFQVKSSEQNIDNYRSSIINQYYKCIQQQTLVDIKSDLEKNTKSQLDIIKLEYELGLCLENNYLEYLISYKKIQDEVRQAERELRALYRVFKVLLGINPDAEIILKKQDCDTVNTEKYLEPYTEKLWNIVKNKNPTIKKNDIMMYYQKQQYLYNRRFFIPELTFQGGVSYKGKNYPLREPQYSAKIMVNFANMPFFPTSLSNSYGFANDKLKSVNNSVSSSLSLAPDYFYNRRLASVQLQQNRQSCADELNKMYETFFSQISYYDGLVDNILRLDETIELQIKRIIISEKQVEKGEMKRIDFLKELIELSEQRIQMEQAKINVSAAARNLEILMSIPFGGLEKCLED